MLLPRVIAACTAVATLVIAGCGGDDPAGPPGPISAVIVSGAAGNIGVGDSLPLRALVLDASGRRVPDATVGWRSLDTATIRISDAGVVTGWEAGAGRVVAEAGPAADTLSLLVELLPREIDVNDGAFPDTLHLGWTGTVMVSVLDGRGRRLAAPPATIALAIRDTAVARLRTANGGTTLRAGLAGQDTLVVTMAGLRRAFPFVVAPNAVSLQGTGITAVALGWSHGCGLTTAGAARCWGANHSGQLGRGSLDASGALPIAPVSGALTFASIVAGRSGACGITAQRRLHCWGPSAAPTLATVPTPMLEGIDVETAAISYEGRTCASTTTQGVWCWMASTSTSTGNVPVQTPDVPPLVQMDMGQTTTGCGVTAANVAWCWSGTLANQPFGIPPVKQVVQGATAWCGLALDGVAHCWGRNEYGELGRGLAPIEGWSYPSAPVTGAQRFTKLVAGGRTTCGLATDGIIWCWGAHPFLSFDRDLFMLVPTRLFGGATFIDILDTSGSGVCGRLASGDLRCVAWRAEPNP